jgi:hypothetical protein
VHGIDFSNRTSLDNRRLRALIEEGVAGWNTGALRVRIRYSRGADFSGSCYYTTQRIFLNVGKHLKYPYRLRTHLARARVTGRQWFKPRYAIELADGYQLVAFLFMHELYHLLVRRAGRNTRQKESMCDRFAARFVVDRFPVSVCDPEGLLVPRQVWDFQDLDGFVCMTRIRELTPSIPAQFALADTDARRTFAPC